jgi:hypothetical protein
VKNIILYSRELKPQNLYPKRIISPPAPNKCCPARMEVLGRPRVDELGRRFCYKRCRVCGFALRHFLEPVGTVITPATPEARPRKPLAIKDRPPVVPPYRPPERRIQPAGRKPASSRHVPRAASRPRRHAVEAGRKSAARRRR